MEDRVLMTWREPDAEFSSCLDRFYLRAVQDVPIDHLSINGHQHPQVNVHTVRIQTHQSEDVKEELGPQSQILHHKREGQNLRRLIPDEGLLWMHIHQLDEHTNMQTCNQISNAYVVWLLIHTHVNINQNANCTNLTLQPLHQRLSDQLLLSGRERRMSAKHTAFLFTFKNCMKLHTLTFCIHFNDRSYVQENRS